MGRVLVVEPVAPGGIEILAAAHETEVRLELGREELIRLLSDGQGYDALVIRSQTRVDAALLAAAAPRLSVVGVASIGVDKIDLEAATRAGVMVVNAPTGNAIAAAEHTMALLLSLMRRIPPADASIRSGAWDRAQFTGSELRGKVLGIIGLGKIGRLVCRRALAFDMKVLTHDPYITADQASEVGARLVGLAELLARADVLTVHTPLTDRTRGMIGTAQLEALRPGAVVLNVARGGIVDEAALTRSLASGHIAGAALDVFSSEPMLPNTPLRDAPNTVLTPHLGASTREAQARVGLEMAEQVVMALAGVTPPYALNAPAVAVDVAPRLRPYVELARRLAILARQLSDVPIAGLGLTYAGEIAAWDGSPLRTAALVGVLEAVTDQRVNAVNAELVTSFTTSVGTRNSQGVWTPKEASMWLAYTKSVGGRIAATEFMNEPTYAAMGGAPKRYNAADYGRDVAVFARWLKQNSPATVFLGPGSVGEGPYAIEMGGMLHSEDLLRATGPAFDIFSYHLYAAASQRCASMGDKVQTTAAAALSEDWLSRPEKINEYYANLRDRFEPGKPLWITETADAACGGN